MLAGEENRRHRRTHVAQKQYVDPQGRKGVRLQFYLQGVRILQERKVPSTVYNLGEEQGDSPVGCQRGFWRPNANTLSSCRGLLLWIYSLHQPCMYWHPSFPQVDNLLHNTVVVVDNRGALWTQGAALGGGESA